MQIQYRQQLLSSSLSTPLALWVKFMFLLLLLLMFPLSVIAFCSSQRPTTLPKLSSSAAFSSLHLRELYLLSLLLGFAEVSGCWVKNSSPLRQSSRCQALTTAFTSSGISADGAEVAAARAAVSRALAFVSCSRCWLPAV